MERRQGGETKAGDKKGDRDRKQGLFATFASVV